MKKVITEQKDRFGKNLNIGDTVKFKSNEIMTVIDTRAGDNGLKVRFASSPAEGWIDSSFVFKLGAVNDRKKD